MIHAYLTDGMFELAEVFLESLYKTNGTLFNVLLSTRNLLPYQVEKLKSIYPGTIEIENKNLDMDRLAVGANCSIDKLVKYKKEVESGYVTQQNKVWKLMIAAEDRPRSLYELLLRGYGVTTPIVHFDIDTLFRKNIYVSITTQAMKHDCCLLLRENHSMPKAKITISTMTWRRNNRTLFFFERWMHYLDLIEPDCRPIGYGQTSCLYAFQEAVKEGLDYHKLSKQWGYPGRKKKKDTSYVWSGAIHKLRKEDCVEYFKNELEGLQCEL